MRIWIDQIYTPRFITQTLRDPRHDKKLDLTKHPSHFPTHGRAPLVHHLKTTLGTTGCTRTWIRTYLRERFWHQDADMLLWFAERNWPLGFLIDEQPTHFTPEVDVYVDMTELLLRHYARRGRFYIARSFLDGWTRHVLESELGLDTPEYPAVCDNQGRNI